MGGRRGDLRAKADLTANSIAAYGEGRLVVAEGLTAIGGIQFTSGRRKADHLPIPTRSDSRSYDEWLPKLGLLYEPADAQTFYANVRRTAVVQHFYTQAMGFVHHFVPMVSL